MLIDIHTHMDDVVGGSQVLTGQERVNYQRWIADLSMMRNYLNGLKEFSVAITGDDQVCACVLAIEPNSNFERLLEYREQDNRILAFLSPDFTLPDAQMVDRIKAYAPFSFGMKIHPIIQGIRVNNPKVVKAIKAYSEYGKPIILHTGEADYGNYFKPCPYDKTLSDIESTIELVNAFPDVIFILGHAGMFQHAEWAKRLSQFKNVYIDSSFKYAKELTLLKSYYGTEKILFGSDFPFHEPSDLDDIALAFSPEEQAKIYSKNAQSILKI